MDINNSYDRVEWEYLRKTLPAFCFHEHWVLRNMYLVAFISYKYQVNGFWKNVSMYLGIPSEWGRSKVQALEWIKEKIFGKMEGWKEKLTNPAGKEVLTKEIVQAIQP